MDTFLDILEEVVKGIISTISVLLFQQIFLDKKKTTQGRRKHKGGHKKN